MTDTVIAAAAAATTTTAVAAAATAATATADTCGGTVDVDVQLTIWVQQSRFREQPVEASLTSCCPSCEVCQKNRCQKASTGKHTHTHSHTLTHVHRCCCRCQCAALRPRASPSWPSTQLHCFAQRSPVSSPRCPCST